MEMEMQMENEEYEENMFCLDVNEEMEVEEPISRLMEDEVLVPTLIEESINVSKQEEEVVENEEEESTFKLHHIDTETLVKNEIKQLILTKVSEETNAKVLSDMNCEMEEEIATLKAETDKQLNKNKELEEEVEMDKNRLLQSVDILVKTNEMVELLKENVGKLDDLFKECHMPEILEKSQKQYKNLEILNNSYLPKIEKENDKIKEMLAIGNERNNLLRAELEHRQQIVNDLKSRHDEIKKITSCYDEEIEQNLEKRQILEQKLADYDQMKRLKLINTKKEVVKHEEETQKLLLKKDKQIERFDILNKRKLEMQEQLDQCVKEIDVMKANVVEIQEKIKQKERSLEEIAETLKLTKKHCDDNVQQLQEDHKKICCELEEVTANVSSATERNKTLEKELGKVKVGYLKICEENLSWTDKILKEQGNLHEVEKDFLLKKMELDSRKTKFEELQKQHEESLARSRELDEEILKQKEKIADDVAVAAARYENLKSEHEQQLLELQKKKEYSLATANYLTEKVGLLRQEVAKREEQNRNLQNELKELKKSSEAPLKSGFKSPSGDKVAKSVKFNEVISIKSATESSQNSSQPVESETQTVQAETSFREWLQDADDQFFSQLEKLK